MSSETTLYLRGISYKAYIFQVFDLSDTFEKVGGVYIFTNRLVKPCNTGIHKILHVGKTKDFSTQFQNHHKKDCLLAKEANRIGIIEVVSEEEKDLMVKDLIRQFKPKCNE